MTSGIDLPLADLLLATGGRPTAALTEQHRSSVRFSNVVVDSREAAPGALFVALRGEQHDGHAFVRAALELGAAAALVERAPDPGSNAALIVVPDTYLALQDLGRFWRARLSPLVVGVTGSVGKTTTKEAIAQVLAPYRRVLKNEGNLNTEVGLPLTLLRARPEHQVLVLEMGMYDVGDIRLLADIARPTIGVVTNVQPVHLERVGSIERVQQGKQELIEALPADGVAVLNYDDPRVRAMVAVTAARAIGYGYAPDAEVRAEDAVGLGLDGVDFTLLHQDRRQRVHLRSLGVHSVQAALAAVAVALAAGLDFDQAAAGLEQVTSAARIVVQQGIRGARILDDTYNASPESAIAALNLLASLAGHRVAVLGDMFELGSYEETGHRRVGRRAGEVAHTLVTVGTRARWIAEEARLSPHPPATIYEAADQAEAVAWLRGTLSAGDTVLVKGSRGMQMERVARALVALPGD